MHNVVTVCWGDKFSKDYVNILFDGIKRNTEKELKYICYTDDPSGIDEYIETRPLPGNLKGWWNKLYLFGEKFEGQVFFFDLDTIILSNFDDILDYNGEFCILRDFYRPDGYGSGLMSWRGDHSYIWEKFKEEGFPELQGGDQIFIERHVKADLWQDKFNSIVSYKQNDCERWPPHEAKIVCFHGVPKPHEVKGSWVEKCWKKEGMRHLTTLGNHMNTPPKVALEQMRENCKLELPWFIGGKKNNKTLCIVGGAPSLKNSMGKLRDRIKLGADVISLNGTLKFLFDKGIRPDFHCQFDAREGNVEFVKDAPDGVYYLIGSMSHPKVFEELKGKDVTVWHADIVQPEQEEILKEFHWKPGMLVGGGATVGLRALYIGFLMGYRKFVVFGMDSCFEESDHHAYSQPLNDMDGKIEVWAGGKKYICAPWMYRQANEFGFFFKELSKRGCAIKVEGEGLVPEISRVLNGQLRQSLINTRQEKMNGTIAS